MTDSEEPEAPQPMTVAVYGKALREISTVGAKGEWYSFDPTTTEGAGMLVAATLGEPEKLGKMAGETIGIVHFYACDASKQKQDGEVDEWTRIVLFTDDGKCYSCGSRGVAKSLAVLLRIRGNMPWNPPVKCKVRVDALPGPKLWITLFPDMGTLIRQPS